MPTATSARVTPPTSVDLDSGTAAKDAERALRDFLVLQAQSYETAEVVPGLADVADGFALGEVQAGAAERYDSDVRQVAGPKIASLKVKAANARGTPPEVILNVCLDSADVDIVDRAGNSLKDRLYQPGYPVLNVYGVRHDGTAWKVTTHTIPDNARCKGSGK